MVVVEEEAGKVPVGLSLCLGWKLASRVTYFLPATPQSGGREGKRSLVTACVTSSG